MGTKRPLLYRSSAVATAFHRYMLLLSRAAPPCKIPCFSLARGFLLPLASPLLQTTLRASRARSARQGPRHLRPRRSPAHRRDRSHLRVRLRARLGHSGQGQGPDADLGVLVRADRPHRRQPRDLDRSRRLSRRRSRRRGTASRAARCSCRKTEPLPIECVARGYLSGSGWKDYVGDRRGLRHRPADGPASSRSRLPEPIFTPATKAQSGHDINISADEAARAGRTRRVLARVRDLTLRAVPRRRRARRIVRHHRRRHEVRIRPAARGRAAAQTIALILIDEVLTPDSSRFWPRDGYAPGGPQPSFDKQFVRDYLEQIQLEQAAAGALAARRRRR